MGISDNDAETEVNDAIANDPEAQKLQDILTQLGLSLDVNGATGCMVDEEVIEDSDDSSSSTGTSSASVRSQRVYDQRVRAQQTEPEIVYTTTPAGSNGMLHMVEGVNEENNLWLSWSQGSQNNRRDMITHIELFGDNSALDAALAQNMALGVRFTTLDDYNKRRIIHQLAQHTTLGQGATYAASSQSNGEQEVTSLQFGGQLLDVKNAEAVIVNQAIDPNNSAQLYGEALVVLPLVSNSRGSGVVNFALDDALYIRVPVIADVNMPVWQIGITSGELPGPLTEPAHFAPTASFVYSPSVDLLINEDIQFDGSGSTDSDGTIENYIWDFGDGTSVSGNAVVTHQYATSGTYQISLTVVDNHGNSSTAATTQITVNDPLPPFDPNEMRVKIWTPSSTQMKVQILGHGSWVTQHDFAIDLEMLTYPIPSIARTDGFTGVTGSATGDAQITSINDNSTSPYLTGKVGTGSVTFTINLLDNVKYVEFDQYLDMDGNGTQERGPGPVPIFVAIGSDTRKVDRTNNKFRINALNPELLPLSWSNIQHCDAAGGGCTLFTASAAASSSSITNLTPSWSAPVTSTPKRVSSAQANPIILDPDILDYWKTPLVVPRDFSLTTETLGDITRDNFYRNYTTERADVLDIRAYSRWGYDFASAFDYCPYTYYDELAPFKRVLCEEYWDLWYARQWDKGLAQSSALEVNNTASQVGLDTAVYVGDLTSELDLTLQGFEDLDEQDVNSILDDVKAIDHQEFAVSPSRQAARDSWLSIDKESLYDWIIELREVNTLGTYEQNFENIKASHQDIYNALEEYIAIFLGDPNTTVKEVLQFVINTTEFEEIYQSLTDQINGLTGQQIEQIWSQQALETTGEIPISLEQLWSWFFLSVTGTICALPDLIVDDFPFSSDAPLDFLSAMNAAIGGIIDIWGEDDGLQFQRAVYTILDNVIDQSPIPRSVTLCGFIAESAFTQVVLSIASDLSFTGSAPNAYESISKIMVAGFAIHHNPKIEWFGMDLNISAVIGDDTGSSTIDLSLYNAETLDFMMINIINVEITAENYKERALEYSDQLRKTLEFLESPLIVDETNEISIRNGNFKREADLAILVLVFHGQTQNIIDMDSLAYEIETELGSSKYPILLVWENYLGNIFYDCVLTCDEESLTDEYLKATACALLGKPTNCDATDADDIIFANPNQLDSFYIPKGESKISTSPVPPPVTTDCNFESSINMLCADFF